MTKPSSTQGPRPTTPAQRDLRAIPQNSQDECYNLLLRKKLYRGPEESQTALDDCLKRYNQKRPHSGRCCYGKAHWETSQATRLLELETDLSRGGDQSDSTVLEYIVVC